MYKDITDINIDSTGVNAIKQSIKNILLTRRGSVPGKPRFGCDIYNIIFNPLDHLTISMARNYIKEALSEYEQRITVQKVDIEKVEEYNRMVINVTFTYRDLDFNADVGQITDAVAVSYNL